MVHLAVNPTLPRQLKARYRFLLGLAPFGLMLAWSVVLLVPEARFNAAFSAMARVILGAEPTQSQEAALVIALIVSAMVLGYALGWFVNEMVARLCLGWSSAKIRAVFSRSEVPPDWIMRGATAPETLAFGRSSPVDAERARSIALNQLLWGVPGWGVPMFIAMYLIPAWWNHTELHWPGFVNHLLIWCSGGAVFGAGLAAVTWFRFGREGRF